MLIFRAVEGFPVRIYFFIREKTISRVTEFGVNQTNVLGSSDSWFIIWTNYFSVSQRLEKIRGSLVENGWLPNVELSYIPEYSMTTGSGNVIINK